MNLGYPVFLRAACFGGEVLEALQETVTACVWAKIEELDDTLD